MDAMLRAMADGTRRQILALVWSEERTAGEIAAQFETMSRPAISQHLGVLLESTLVSARREGTRRHFRANQQAFIRLRTALDVFWNDRLGRLKQAAEAAERKSVSLE